MLLKANETARIPFFLTDVTDNETPETSVSVGTITCEISRNGQAWQTCTSTPGETGEGWYIIDLTATETNNPGPLLFRAVASGTNIWNDYHQVVEHLMSDADVARVADIILRRDFANVEASSHGDAKDKHSLLGVGLTTHKCSVSGTTVTIYETDGVTVLGTFTITVDGNGDWTGKS